MTIHDDPAQYDRPTEDGESLGAPTLPADPSTTRPEATGPQVPTAPRESAEPSSEASPFFGHDMEGLRGRWNSVQAAFVDDPRDCVQRADALVSDVVKQLVTGFSDARTRLEERWGRGEEASTEDLRVALTRYREFFERLLAV